MPQSIQPEADHHEQGSEADDELNADGGEAIVLDKDIYDGCHRKERELDTWCVLTAKR